MWERTYYQAGHGVRAADRGRGAHRRAASACSTTSRRSGSSSCASTCRCRRSSSTASGSRSRAPRATRLSDTITHCVALEAAMKQRQAQAYLLYGMDLEEHFGDFPVERPRESFLHDDVWQPARRYVERLRATPRLGRAGGRRQPLLRAAGRAADPARAADALRPLQRRHRHPGASATSPSSSGSGCAAGRPSWCASCWTDAEHGAANREVVAGWLEEWLPLAEEAARGARAGVRRAAGRHRVRRRARERADRRRRAVRASAA